jgi:mRNA-degrading endonuclease RelE of RelBE toxin-antitoxin system
MRQFQSITIRNERQFIAFTGLPQKVFDILLPEFSKCLESTRQQNYQNNLAQRQRKPGGGRQGVLSTPELKLFFILFYLKNYPTFDVLGGLFNLSLSKAKENVSKLLPILKQVEKNLHRLPRRHFKLIVDNNGLNGKNNVIHKIMIDATERPCCRPQHDRKQKHYYSGKKHAHTLKNTVIAEVNKGIAVVGPTAPGSRHDYALLKEELDPNQGGYSSVEAYVDLGYQGIKSRYPNFHEIHIPYKKHKKSINHPKPTLTRQQKKENRSISRVRVGVEHLIGDLKIFQILTNKFRNHAINIADQAILIIAGLCNLKNNYMVQ